MLLPSCILGEAISHLTRIWFSWWRISWKTAKLYSRTLASRYPSSRILASVKLLAPPSPLSAAEQKTSTWFLPLKTPCLGIWGHTRSPNTWVWFQETGIKTRLTVNYIRVVISGKLSKIFLEIPTRSQRLDLDTWVLLHPNTITPHKVNGKSSSGNTSGGKFVL